MNNSWPKLFNKQNEYKLTLSYDITMSCNNRCDYCSRGHELDNSKIFNREIFEETINQTLKFINENPEYVIVFEVLGGDPLVTYKETIELIERLQHPRIYISVFTNLNFNPNSKTISAMIEAGKKFKFTFVISWHDISNIEHLKTNIKLIDNFDVQVVLLVNDEKLTSVYANYNWIKDNTKCRIVVEELTKLNEITFTQYNDKRYIEMVTSNILYQTADNRGNKITIDDEEFNPFLPEVKLMDFRNISSQYFTMCKLASFRIQFDGTIMNTCAYKINNEHITKGFPIKEVFCDSKLCFCSTDNYKKLLRPRKKD